MRNVFNVSFDVKRGLDGTVTVPTVMTKAKTWVRKQRSVNRVVLMEVKYLRIICRRSSRC